MAKKTTAPKPSIWTIPYQVWRKIDPKKTDSWLSAVLGVFLRTTGLLLLIFAVLILWRIVRNNGFVLEDFSVPKSMDEAGLTGHVTALRLQDAIQHLKDEAASVKKDDFQVGGNDAQNSMNVQVMGVAVSLNSIAHQLRQLFGQPHKGISGEFVQSGNRLSIHLRMSGYKSASFESEIDPDSEENTVKKLLALAAEKILGHIDPYRMAVVYFRRENNSAAIDMVRAIIRDREIERPWAYHIWGNILVNQGRFEEAAAKYKHATELDSTFSISYQQWGRALLASKKYAEAVEKLEKSVKFNPENLDGWLTLGWQYHMRGDSQKCDQAFSNGVKAAAPIGMESAAWQAWIGMKMQNGDFASAKRLAEQALQTAPETSDGYITRSMVYLLRKDTLLAFENAQHALELDPFNVSAIQMVSRGLFATKRYRELCNLIQDVKFNPWQSGQAITILNLGSMAHNNLGEHDAAFSVIQQAIALDSTQATPYTTLAETYAYQKNHPMFYQSLEKAFELGFRVQQIGWTEPPYNRYAGDKRLQQLKEKYSHPVPQVASRNN